MFYCLKQIKANKWQKSVQRWQVFSSDEMDFLVNDLECLVGFPRGLQNKEAFDRSFQVL